MQTYKLTNMQIGNGTIYECTIRVSIRCYSTALSSAHPSVFP